MSKVTPIPTDLMAERTAQAIIDKARVIDTRVEQALSKPALNYYEILIAPILSDHKRIAGVDDGAD